MIINEVFFFASRERSVINHHPDSPSVKFLMSRLKLNESMTSWQNSHSLFVFLILFSSLSRWTQSRQNCCFTNEVKYFLLFSVAACHRQRFRVNRDVVYVLTALSWGLKLYVAWNEKPSCTKVVYKENLIKFYSLAALWIQAYNRFAQWYGRKCVLSLVIA